ncbi:MarR family winged helix-turn-helix transcriptional regulator [Frondihabitans sp. PAMC 28766]|uniref:MarR family winged helix-turn-helix transcriptional regulator n=1 Tax=Frondihabitans sp. PAMC 28766 TaxID=1795630 RepID=UPI0012FF6769|nr:MarR family winged helix-turn-helix transcriptional regulator [Frondihabitans sp. PAMC 28766]
MQADEDGGLDDIVTWNVVRVARFLGGRMSARLAGHGLNPIHFGVLAYLAEQEEMTTADIARSVLVTPQSMSPLLDGLEQRGMVRRTGVRARGQRNPVQITAFGREALATVWDIAQATNDLTDAGLTAGESTQLNHLLRKVLGATNDSGQPDTRFDASAQTGL